MRGKGALVGIEPVLRNFDRRPRFGNFFEGVGRALAALQRVGWGADAERKERGFFLSFQSRLQHGGFHVSPFHGFPALDTSIRRNRLFSGSVPDLPGPSLSLGCADRLCFRNSSGLQRLVSGGKIKSCC